MSKLSKTEIKMEYLLLKSFQTVELTGEGEGAHKSRLYNPPPLRSDNENKSDIYLHWVLCVSVHTQCIFRLECKTMHARSFRTALLSHVRGGGVASAVLGGIDRGCSLFLDCRTRQTHTYTHAPLCKQS